MGFSEYKAQDKKVAFLVYSGIHMYSALWHHVVWLDYELSSPDESVLIYMSKAKMSIFGHNLLQLFMLIHEQELSFVKVDADLDLKGPFVSAIHVELNED